MYLDYLTECTRPGSATRCVLLPAFEEGKERVRCLAAALPSAHHAVFPQLLVSPDWPRLLLIHGSEDIVMPADSSRETHARLRAAKAETVLRFANGSEHFARP